MWKYSDGARKIDHNETADNHEEADTSADPDGAEARAMGAGESVLNPDKRPTPQFILDEFAWVLRQGVIDSPENRQVDNNWQLRPLQLTVATVVAGCPGVYEARNKEIRADKNKTAMQEKFHKAVVNLLQEAQAENGWLMYGCALALLSQAAKEIASSVRFAQRANDWQQRLNDAGDTEEMGPSNMTESAFEQATRGTALANAVIQAYNETSDEGAISLNLNVRAFRTATYTALNIEANKHKQNYDHPGKALIRKTAAAGAASAINASFMGTSQPDESDSKS